ncbi:hypothetical protein [Daejeonella lutea]|uniref:Uncharacterized protein n=1 Tax=Daejeonella lutea TaxID=572036 RepID=A0A1T5D5G4_9SPHI|nr:hypothetical protein [Daejeonella lutea]SKB66952.1 hypothetical protein SAMN05661099_2161 [Daejeonella lutea]
MESGEWKVENGEWEMEDGNNKIGKLKKFQGFEEERQSNSYTQCQRTKLQRKD